MNGRYSSSTELLLSPIQHIFQEITTAVSYPPIKICADVTREKNYRLILFRIILKPSYAGPIGNRTIDWFCSYSGPSTNWIEPSGCTHKPISQLVRPSGPGLSTRANQEVTQNHITDLVQYEKSFIRTFYKLFFNLQPDNEMWCIWYRSKWFGFDRKQ